MLLIERPMKFRYRSAELSPPVPEGEMDTFIVAVHCEEDGRINCFPADYLNNFPLWDDPPEAPDANGWWRVMAEMTDCRATGWFDHLPDGRNGAIILPMLLKPTQYLIGWCPIGDFVPKQKI